MELNKNFDATYAPKSLNDIAFTYKQDQSKLQSHVNGQSGFPGSGKTGILLVGGTGSGKSTLAKLLPNLIETARGGVEACENYIQITTTNNGVAIIDNVKNQVALVPLQQQFHYIVLDEVDLLSPAAMGNLKGVMNIGYSTSIFIMTTNNFKKIDPAVVNRCHEIWLDHAPASAWLPLYRRILDDHGITHVSNAEILENIDKCNGSCRDVIDSAKNIILDCDQEMLISSFTANSVVV